MPFSHDELAELPKLISAPRFATYLQACANHTADALELYQWNLEISAAFIVPIQICEIGVRNAVVEAIECVHGQNWPWSNGFIRSLPIPKVPTHYNPQQDLRRVASNQPTTGKVVAELKFAFWEKTFTRGQDSRLWLPYFRQVLPGSPVTLPISQARAHMFDTLQAIRRFRNRIAYHEPIFTRNLAVEYSRLKDVITWRSPMAAAWLDRIERVNSLIRQRP